MTHVLKHNNKPLQTIMAKLDELREFARLFALHLNPEIAAHCEIAKFEKNCLIVIVENGNWATQLRFHIPDLMSKLRQHPGLEKLNGIVCKTRPISTLSKTFKLPRKRKVGYLTAQAAESVLEAAGTIRDTKLRGIMERIARYVKG